MKKITCALCNVLHITSATNFFVVQHDYHIVIITTYVYNKVEYKFVQGKK